MRFETDYSREIALWSGAHPMIQVYDTVHGDGIAAALTPEQMYKIHDWIAENVERPFKPKNAREIIDSLPSGATFTLTSNTGKHTRYFQKVDINGVVEYTDEHMDQSTQEFNLAHENFGKSLFTSWRPETYAEFTPVERKPLSIQHWEQMPVGAEFGFGDGGFGPREDWFFPYTKMDERYYGSPNYKRDFYTDTTPNDRSRGLFWRAERYVYGPEPE